MRFGRYWGLGNLLVVFFPLCSDFSTVSTYLVEGEQNTAPQWAMLARGLSWAEGHRDAAEPGGPPASLSAFRNCGCGPRQTEPPAAMAVLWLAGQQLPLSAPCELPSPPLKLQAPSLPSAQDTAGASARWLPMGLVFMGVLYLQNWFITC